MGPQLQFGDHQGFSGFSTSSVLHINNYRPNTIAAAEAAANGTATAVAQVPVAANEAAAAASSEHYHLLHGTEAHIDRGLLTVIYSTGPGLEVGFRAGTNVLDDLSTLQTSCKRNDREIKETGNSFLGSSLAVTQYQM